MINRTRPRLGSVQIQEKSGKIHAGNNYWSATTQSNNTNNAWNVNLNNGNVNNNNKTNTNDSRCVR